MTSDSNPAGNAVLYTRQITYGGRWRSPDWRRLLQLALGVIWLLDGVLQLQPFMFTPGSNGLSGMLRSVAPGNPRWVAHSITWNASIVDHHPDLTNAAFALIQILLGLGIAWRRTTKPALGASVVWSLGVWWFGEGLGGLFTGAGTPIGGGPGAVLFYALLAVLLWPAERARSTSPFAAAGAVGVKTAKAIWVVVWAGLAVLVIGSGRSPQGVHDLIESLKSGEPGWLAALDRHAGSALGHDGLAVAIVFAAVCLVVATSVFLTQNVSRAILVLAIVSALAVWVVGENFGMIFPGGATDPSSGPLLVLLALAYWPLRPGPATDAVLSPALRAAAVPVEA